MEFFPEITNNVVVFSLNAHKPFVVTWNNAKRLLNADLKEIPSIHWTLTAVLDGVGFCVSFCVFPYYVAIPLLLEVGMIKFTHVSVAKNILSPFIV